MVTCQHHAAMPMTNPRLSSSSSAWAVSWSTPRPSSNGLSTGTPDVRLWETPVAETVHLPNMGKNCKAWQSWIIKTHKTVILGDFRHNTTTNSIWNDQENTWPGGSWEFVEKIFSIWRHETDMKSKVKINMLQPLSYSLPLHCSSFVQAFLCFNNPWATSIPIDLDWSGRTNQVGLQVLSEGNMQRCYTANKHFRFVFWSLKHVWAFLNLWDCMALSTVQGTLSESTLDIHGQQPAIRHLCWQKKVRYRERIRSGNANIVYACYRSFWLVSRL